MATNGTAGEKPWTQEMIIVHRVFRRELKFLAGAVGSVPAGDTARAKVLADHCTFATMMLHHHHAGEDELLWPRLKERVAMETELIDRMEAQHHGVSGLIDGIDPLLSSWLAAPGPETAAPLSSALTALLDALNEHLADEEAHILPLAEEHLTVAEWGELGKRGMASIPGPKRLFTLGMLMEEATPDEEARFLGDNVPAVPRTLYKVVGRRQYAKQIAHIRASAT